MRRKTAKSFPGSAQEESMKFMRVGLKSNKRLDETPSPYFYFRYSIEYDKLTKF